MRLNDLDSYAIRNDLHSNLIQCTAYRHDNIEPDTSVDCVLDAVLSRRRVYASVVVSNNLLVDV